MNNELKEMASFISIVFLAVLVLAAAITFMADFIDGGITWKVVREGIVLVGLVSIFYYFQRKERK